MRMRILLSFICTIIIYFSCQPALVKKRPQYDYDGMDSRTVEVHKLIEDFLFYVQETGYPIYVPASTRIEKINVSDEQKRIAVTLSEVFSQIPFREDNVFQTYQEMKKTLGDDFEDYSFYIITLNKPIEELIPNYYRSDKKKWDRQRMPNTSKMYPVPIVRKYDPDFIPKKRFIREEYCCVAQPRLVL